jgi:hypothetical protein
MPLPIEHTTITMSVESRICPAPDVAAPLLQQERGDITLVSVDGSGTLETTDNAQCCYLVTYRTRNFD